MAEKKITKTAEKDTPPDNLSIYEKAREVPKYALKTITAGRIKGMTDINPMFRIKRMTELFGPCGIGWKYEIVKQWLESYGNEVKAFTNINLYFKWNGEWSEAIPGTGGSSFVAQERSGAYVNDECWKMALTDALSVAMKALGVAADIYYAKDGKPLNPGDSKYQPLTDNAQPKTTAQPKPMSKEEAQKVSTPSPLTAAKAECNAAKTLEEQMAVWHKHPELHGNPEFLLAMSTKKKEFQK